MSISRCRGWFLFRFWGRSDRVRREMLRAGQTGEKVGYLCIVLPDDDEQFTIKVTVNCF